LRGEKVADPKKRNLGRNSPVGGGGVGKAREKWGQWEYIRENNGKTVYMACAPVEVAGRFSP